jgi:dolichyl-phosphate beta-glucosyltransferase
MPQKPYLSVIIPAYNEAKRLPLTLIDIDKHLSKAKFSYEIIVANDGSTDNTAEVVKKMASTIKNLKILDNKVNQGKGGVVKQGMLVARGDIRIFTDADNSTSINHFFKAQALFENGADVVIGSRAIIGSKLDPPQPIYRQIPGKVGNLIIQILVLPGIWDTQCGFKAFKEKAAEKIFNIAKVTGWGFDIEALALAKKFGYEIREIPVHWVNDTSSTVKASAYLKTLIETVKIRWWLWTDKYGLKSDNLFVPNPND